MADLQVQVDAALQVEDLEGQSRSLSLTDLAAAATGAASEDTLTAVLARLNQAFNVNVANVPATQDVTGTVEVSNFPATQPVSGTVALDAATLAALEQTTVTVANPTAAPETGLAKDATLTARLPTPVSGRVPVDGSAVTQPVSASALPLPAGAATAAGVTEVRDRLQVPDQFGTDSDVTRLPHGAVTGTISASGQEVVLPIPRGGSGLYVEITGTAAGTLQFERSGEGTSYRPTLGRLFGLGGQLVNTLTLNGAVSTDFRGNMAGVGFFRVRASAWTSGSLRIYARVDSATGPVFQNAQLPRGEENIGGLYDPLQYFCTALGGFMGFNAASDVVAVGSLGGNVVSITNPAGSGRNVHLWKAILGCKAAGNMRRFRNPTITGALTTRPAVNRGGGTTTPVAEVRAGANIGTVVGGTLGNIEFMAANASRVQEFHGTLILRPGDIALYTFTTDANLASSAAIDLVWWEAVV